MSYVKYGNKFVQSGGHYVGKVSIVNLIVMNWDINNNAITLTGQPDLSGNKIITCDVWLNKESGFNVLSWFSLGAAPNNIVTFMIDDVLQIAVSGSTAFGGLLGYSLAGLSNKFLHCEIIKHPDHIDSFLINGVLQTPILTGTSSSETTVSRIGADGSATIGPDKYLKDMYIWHVGVDGIGYWDGTGLYANTDSAWVDQVLGDDGIVSGGPKLKYFYSY